MVNDLNVSIYFTLLYYFYQFKYGKRKLESQYFTSDSLVIGSHSVKFDSKGRAVRIAYFNANGIMKNAIEYEYPKDARMIISQLIPFFEGKPPKNPPTFDIDCYNIKWKLGDYSGKEPPWQYPTAIEFISILFWELFILIDFRYFVVLSMHDALDDVYFTIGYMYSIPATRMAE